jgi:hypothetical protein
MFTGSKRANRGLSLDQRDKKSIHSGQLNQAARKA